MIHLLTNQPHLGQCPCIRRIVCSYLLDISIFLKRTGSNFFDRPPNSKVFDLIMAYPSSQYTLQRGYYNAFCPNSIIHLSFSYCCSVVIKLAAEVFQF
jgi:hypothetical protein